MHITRRDFALAAMAGLTVPLLGGAGQAPPARKIEFTADQTADLNRLNDYLDAITTLQADFVQMNPQGNIAQGRFYLARPGKLRFEYQPPSPTLIVATAGRIYVKNSRLNTVDHYDVSDTPLGLLLAPSIDLKRNPAVLGIERQPGALVLKARSSTNRNQDNIAIVFAVPQIELKQWTVKDAQGGITSVALSQVHAGQPLSDDLFAVPVKTPPVPKAGH